MADRRPHDGRTGDDSVAEVRTAISFVVKSVDRLEDAVVRLEQTVRQDFAATGELELVKAGVHELRREMERRIGDIERDVEKQLAGITASTQAQVTAAIQRRETDIRLAWWLTRVGLPTAGIFGLKLVWDLVGDAIKRAFGGGP